jgi:Mannosyl-glycoprotein endo-beta-N-acetylglucosaminidase
MIRSLSGGLALFAGVVALPVNVSVKQAPDLPKHEYRFDPRLESLKRFFQRASCPAVKYVSAFLEAADRYDLDWRLLPSISYVESTGGKSAPNNNLFGWDSGRAQFASPAASIHEVGYQLSHSALYRDKDTDGILATYNSNEEYAAKVKLVMRSIAAEE